MHSDEPAELHRLFPDAARTSGPPFQTAGHSEFRGVVGRGIGIGAVLAVPLLVGIFVWQLVRVPFLAGLVALFALGLAVAARTLLRIAAVGRRAVRWSRARGLSFEERPLIDRFTNAPVVDRGVTQRYRFLMQGRLQDARGEIVRFHAHTPGAGDDSGTSWDYWMLKLPLDEDVAGQVDGIGMERNGALRRLAERVGGIGRWPVAISSGDEQFDRRWAVRASQEQDREIVERLLETPERRAAVTVDPRIEWQACGGELVVYTTHVHKGVDILDPLCAAGVAVRGALHDAARGTHDARDLATRVLQPTRPLEALMPLAIAFVAFDVLALAGIATWLVLR